MPFKYINTDTFDYFEKIMDDCDDYQSAVPIPQFYIYLTDEEDGIHFDYPLWQCDYNKIWDEENKQTIISYINGEHTKNWIDDDEGRWSTIELYFDDCRDNHNGFECVAELVDLNEVRKERKKYAMNYLKKVLPKYIRHHLYKPKAIGAKKAKKEYDDVMAELIKESNIELHYKILHKQKYRDVITSLPRKCWCGKNIIFLWDCDTCFYDGEKSDTDDDAF